MSAPGVVEAIYVAEDGSFRLTPCWPTLPPDQFRLQGFEERLDGGVVIAITFAAHRRAQAISLQFLLIIVGTILAAAIRMEKASFWWLAQAHRHIQRLDRQILLHPVADGPAHDTPAMQIENDGKIEPAFRRPDIR